MLDKEMSRKEFLTVAAAFAGLALLRSLPFVGKAPKREVQGLGSYGISAYGGKK